MLKVRRQMLNDFMKMKEVKLSRRQYQAILFFMCEAIIPYSISQVCNDNLAELEKKLLIYEMNDKQLHSAIESIITEIEERTDNFIRCYKEYLTLKDEILSEKYTANEEMSLVKALLGYLKV